MEKKNYKKLKIAFLCILVLSAIILSFFIIKNYSKKKIEKQNIETFYDVANNFTSIDTAFVEEKINNKDHFFLLTGKPDCSWAQKIVPSLFEISKEENLTIFFLNSEDTETNVDLQNFREYYNIETTPSIIYFDKDGNYFNIEHNIKSNNFDKSFLAKAMEKYILIEKNN